MGVENVFCIYPGHLLTSKCATEEKLWIKKIIFLRCCKSRWSPGGNAWMSSFFEKLMASILNLHPTSENSSFKEELGKYAMHVIIAYTWKHIHKISTMKNDSFIKFSLLLVFFSFWQKCIHPAVEYVFKIERFSKAFCLARMMDFWEKFLFFFLSFHRSH